MSNILVKLSYRLQLNILILTSIKIEKDTVLTLCLLICFNEVNIPSLADKVHSIDAVICLET